MLTRGNLFMFIRNRKKCKSFFSSGIVEIVILVIAGLALVGGVLYFTFLRGKFHQTQEKTSVAVLQDAGLVAFREGGNVLETGNLWLSKYDRSSKRQITQTGTINQVFAWSPDNKYVLVSKVDALSTRESYDLVDVESGSLTPVSIERSAAGDGVSNFVWSSNSDIVYIDNHNIYRVSVDGERTKLVQVPEDSRGISYRLNSSANLALFDTAYPELPMNLIDVYVLNLSNGELKLIEEGASAISWLGGKVVYLQDGKIISANSDGTEKKELFEIDSNWRVTDASGSEDGKKLLYVADKYEGGQMKASIFLYDVDVAEPELLNNIDSGMFVSDLAISRNGKYGAFSLSGIVNAPSIVINLATGITNGLCEHSCYCPVWQN